MLVCIIFRDGWIVNISIYNKHLQAILLNRLTINHILCSNLVHFNYLVKILKETKNVHQVDFPIKCHGHQKAVLRIDIVAEKGGVWIKVIARNPKALNEIALGRSNYGTKSILDHARSYAEAAKENPHCLLLEYLRYS